MDEPQAFVCPDPEVAGTLARVETQVTATRRDVLGLKEEVRLLKEHQIMQNGSVNDLKLYHAMEEGVAKERLRWEEKQAGNMKWLVTAGFAGIGVMVAAIDKLVK